MRVFASLMIRLRASHIRVESIASDEIRDEAAALAGSLRTSVQHTSADIQWHLQDYIARRITFYRCAGLELTNDSSEVLLGFAVIFCGLVLTDSPSQPPKTIAYIYEAAARGLEDIHSIGLSNLGSARTHCLTGITNFRLPLNTEQPLNSTEFVGSYFCEQNRQTHNCAHAAVRMALNSSRRYRGEKITPKFFIDRQSSGSDLSLDDELLDSLAEGLGFTVVKLGQFHVTSRAFQSYVLTSIISGFPTVLVTSGWGTPNGNLQHLHAGAVVGYTLFPNRATPLTRIGRPYATPASAWVDHFLVNDDHSGPYCSWPMEALRSAVLISVQPKGVFGFLTAEVVAAGYTQSLVGKIVSVPDHNKYIDRLKHDIVTNVRLTERGEYIVHLARLNCSNSPVQTSRDFPSRFWLVEIFEPETFGASMMKFGDVLIDASKRIDHNVLFAWFCGVSVAMDGQANWCWPIKEPVASLSISLYGVSEQRCSDDHLASFGGLDPM